MTGNNKSLGIVVRDRRGVLYAIPSEIAKQYVIDEKEFDSAAQFYTAEENDVMGQTIQMDDREWSGSLPEELLINRIPILDRF